MQYQNISTIRYSCSLFNLPGKINWFRYTVKTSNMANNNQNGQLIRLGSAEEWNPAAYPYESMKSFPPYDTVNTYVQRFKNREEAENWAFIVERILAIIYTTTKLRTQKDCVHVYHTTLLEDYLPKLFRRFGYSRIPNLIAEAINTLEDYDRHYDRTYYFWDHAPAPVTPPAHPNNPIPAQIQDNFEQIENDV